MMNPFIHELIKRPHAAVVHFPITLYPVSLFFLLVFMNRDGMSGLLQASYWCFLIGAVSVLPVSVTGLMDLVRLKTYSKKASTYLQVHLINGIMITTLSLISGLYFLMHSPVVERTFIPAFLLTLGVLSLLVLLQGWVAAIMIYQYKLGIEGETRHV